MTDQPDALLPEGNTPTQAAMCEDCPPLGYPTDKTRCAECPHRSAQ